jgi:hypothetical protein
VVVLERSIDADAVLINVEEIDGVYVRERLVVLVRVDAWLSEAVARSEIVSVVVCDIDNVTDLDSDIDRVVVWVAESEAEVVDDDETEAVDVMVTVGVDEAEIVACESVIVVE